MSLGSRHNGFVMLGRLLQPFRYALLRRDRGVTRKGFDPRLLPVLWLAVRAMQGRDVRLEGMEPAEIIDREHARLRERATHIGVEPLSHRRTALIASFIVDYEIHMRIFEELRQQVPIAGDDENGEPETLFGDYTPSERAWLSSVGSLPAPDRSALAGAMTARRQELETQFGDDRCVPVSAAGSRASWHPDQTNASEEAEQ